jgi:hypothetical protein
MPPTYSGTNERGETYTRTWDFAPRVPGSRGAALARLDRLSQLLDTAVAIPGTNIRFGADALIGLVPGIGDVVTTLMSAWIVYEAHQLGAPRHVLARMIGNVALDSIIGAVPIAGDAFDVMWRANRRNYRLLRDWMAREGVTS